MDPCGRDGHKLGAFLGADKGFLRLDGGQGELPLELAAVEGDPAGKVEHNGVGTSRLMFRLRLRSMTSARIGWDCHSMPMRPPCAGLLLAPACCQHAGV